VNRLDQSGRRAFVTGAAQGFGYAIALRLAEHGASLVVADRPGSAIDKAAVTIGEATGAAIEAVELDITDEAGVAAAMRAAQPLDVLVNNAGVFSNFGLVDLASDEFERIVRVNLTGTFRCAREFARHSLDAGRAGVIVNVASVDALAPSCEGQVHYTASKHGVAGLTKALSVELAPHGIRVNAVGPGAALTEGAVAFVAAGAPQGIDLAAQWDGIAARTPMRRLVEAGDVADAVLFLVSDMAASITGVLLPVDGGILAQPLEGYA
jgi:NAD(P)-dependent dehydrogenase (short-subunit alcohol dehydrogenase family)